MMHNAIGFILALLLALGLATLFCLVWLVGTVGDRLTRLFSSD